MKLVLVVSIDIVEFFRKGSGSGRDSNHFELVTGSKMFVDPTLGRKREDEGGC